MNPEISILWLVVLLYLLWGPRDSVPSGRPPLVVVEAESAPSAPSNVGVALRLIAMMLLTIYVVKELL